MTLFILSAFYGPPPTLAVQTSYVHATYERALLFFCFFKGFLGDCATVEGKSAESGEFGVGLGNPLAVNSEMGRA